MHFLLLQAAMLPQIGQVPPPTDGPKVDAGASIFEGTEIFRSEDGRSSIRLDARLTIDGAFYDEGDLVLDGDPDLRLSSGTEVRRARLSAKGILEEFWSYELDVDFADAEVDLNDVWLGRSFANGQRVRFGQFKEPFSLQYVTSSRYNTFLERSLVDALVPRRSIGLGTDLGGRNWSLAGGVFGQAADDVNDGNDFEVADNEGYAAVLRATYAPVFYDDTLVHLGVSLRRGLPDAETDRSDSASDIVRYRIRPETHVNRLRLLDTGRIAGVDWINTYGFEAAAMRGPVRCQAEYIGTRLERSGDPVADFQDASFHGYYSQIAWLITGESPAYRGREGEFGRIIPTRESGAWEVAFRYSELDLDDNAAMVAGGTSRQRTLGVTYYANPWIRTMLNYSWVSNGLNADADGDASGGSNFSILQFRVQLSL